MAFQDTDKILVSRGGVDYQADLGPLMGGGSSKPVPPADIADWFEFTADDYDEESLQGRMDLRNNSSSHDCRFILMEGPLMYNFAHENGWTSYNHVADGVNQGHNKLIYTTEGWLPSNNSKKNYFDLWSRDADRNYANMLRFEVHWYPKGELPNATVNGAIITEPDYKTYAVRSNTFWELYAPPGGGYYRNNGEKNSEELKQMKAEIAKRAEEQS